MDPESKSPPTEPTAGTSLAADAIKAQLDRILASTDFARARRMKRFLGFIVDETLQGRGEGLKEYTIALEVFGRDESFDPTTNALVRVEAGRLRRTLKHYYLTMGRGDPMVIEIPRGGYVPTFSKITEEASLGAAADGGAAPSTARRPDRSDASLVPVQKTALSPTARKPSGGSRTPTILVVDDEPQVEALISQRFRRAVREGALSFLFASDGEQALELLLSNSSIDLVLTDINMPRMDGLSLLDHLDQIDPLLMAVVVSAYGDMNNIRTAMNRGAFDFITKPINFEDLSITIDKALAHKSILDEAAQEHDELDSLRRELKIAARIQQSFKPVDLPPEIAACVAGRTRRAQDVGGDFFDYFPLADNRIAIAIAEVSGSALPAALAAVYCRAALRTSELSGLTLGDTVRRVNDLLCAQSEANMSASLFLGFIEVDTGTIEFVNAGHRAPLVIGADGSISLPGVPFDAALGRDPETQFEPSRLQLRENDILVLYSGGMINAFDRNGRQFSIQRLEECLGKNAALPLAQLIDQTIAEIEDFMDGGECKADLTCLAFKSSA